MKTIVLSVCTGQTTGFAHRFAFNTALKDLAQRLNLKVWNICISIPGPDFIGLIQGTEENITI